MPRFEVVSEYTPSGDQPEAIEALASGLEMGLDEQTLLGVTGSGKTFTMAKVIEKIQRPTLVLAHNKTLAAQLCASSSPTTTTTSRRPTCPRQTPSSRRTPPPTRRSTACGCPPPARCWSGGTLSWWRRVSCIYGLGEPDDFARMMISLRTGMTLERDELLRRLVEDRYERNDVAFQRNVFRVRGDTVELYPAYYKDRAIRVEFFGDEIERITEIHPVTGAALKQLTHVAVYPASHYVTPKDKLERRYPGDLQGTGGAGGFLRGGGQAH